jgi:site-specific DNA-methyltransferase (adenine-specific)
MKALNSDKQMKDVWKLPAVGKWEKSFGKHPTQKPLALLTRLILAASKKGSLILDPFTGSSTTGIAANLLNRNFVGIDNEEDFLELSKNRRLELETEKNIMAYREKIHGFLSKEQLNSYLMNE